jgi:anthranilate synthase component I
MNRFATERLPNAPRFTGGLVGYLSYESVRYFEPTLKSRMTPANGLDGTSRPAGVPDGIYLLADTVVAFDHARRSIFLIANVLDGDVEAANQKLDQIAERIDQPLPAASKTTITPSEIRSNMTQEAFETIVCEAKEHIAAGDIFQVVLSQRVRLPLQVDPFLIYRQLRRINPSPYLFFLRAGPERVLIGSSPEILVRVEDGRIDLRPIAGTRPRGQGAEADRALEAELLADPKERAEHLMLVDLGRNDVGRVAKVGSVQVTEYAIVERYSHVMHIVSNVQGELRPDLDWLDLLRATFPAGTLSGAPKVRAMEIIDELETRRRGPYGGCVGYVDYSGNMDMAIAIRTMLIQDEAIFVQSGGGIVADSDPETEYQETVHKGRALIQAIDMAREGSD